MESATNQLELKLQLNSVEVNEVNLFCLLMSSEIYAIIEDANERLI